MTLEYRCSHCGWLLQTTNADPLNEEIEKLRALVKVLADDLEMEIEDHYQSVKDHPAVRPKYERDMSNVYAARAFLGTGQEQKLEKPPTKQGLKD